MFQIFIFTTSKLNGYHLSKDVLKCRRYVLVTAAILGGQCEDEGAAAGGAHGVWLPGKIEELNIFNALGSIPVAFNNLERDVNSTHKKFAYGIRKYSKLCSTHSLQAHL